MANSVTFSKLLDHLGETRDRLKGWGKRGLLPGSLPETTQGVARPMTRRAALEIAFMAALNDLGVSAAEASQMARDFAVEERKGSLRPWFIIDPVSPANPAKDII